MINIQKNTPTDIIHYAQFRFDFARCEIHASNEKTELEPKVMAVLALLHKNAGQVVSQQEIFDAVWQGRVYSQSLIQRAITLIRKALNDDAANAKYLLTYPKKGYCLAQQPVDEQPKAVIRTKTLVTALVFALLLISSFFAFLFLSNSESHTVNNADKNSQDPTYTSLTAVAKHQGNQYALSQHPQSGQLLFAKKTDGQFELWHKSKVNEVKLYASEKTIRHTFWIDDTPAFIEETSPSKTLFYHQQGDEFIPFYEKDESLTSSPVVFNSKLFYATKHAIYRVNLSTNKSRILHLFTDIKTIQDIALSKSGEQLAILYETGQLNYTVASLNLSNSHLTERFQDEGKYNAIDWHGDETTLLLTKANTLLQLSFDGTINVINYPTDKEITDAQYSAIEQGIYIEHLFLNVTLVADKNKGTGDDRQVYVRENMHENRKENPAPLPQINYRGANLFPTNNLVNDHLLFQSDHTGLQTLYLQKGNDEYAVGKANSGSHLNGFTWSPRGEKFAYAVDRAIKIANQHSTIHTIPLKDSAYIRGWFKSSEQLLINKIINGQPFPAALDIKTGNVTNLTDVSASCVVTTSDDIYFVIDNKVLFKQTPEGNKIQIHELKNGKYDDLFVSQSKLHASVKIEDTYYVQTINLLSNEVLLKALPNKRILAGVTKESDIWAYQDIEYQSSLHKLF